MGIGMRRTTSVAAAILAGVLARHGANAQPPRPEGPPAPPPMAQPIPTLDMRAGPMPNADRGQVTIAFTLAIDAPKGSDAATAGKSIGEAVATLMSLAKGQCQLLTPGTNRSCEMTTFLVSTNAMTGLPEPSPAPWIDAGTGGRGWSANATATYRLGTAER